MLQTFVSAKVWRLLVAFVLCGGLFVSTTRAHVSVVRADSSTDTLYCLKNPDACGGDGDGLSAGAEAAKFGPQTSDSTEPNNPQPGYHDHGRGGNTFVNDPCIDPPPPSRQRTVQSETEMASFGNYMVAGYNNSRGFYNNTEGLSGFAYSINGGNTWIDGGGLPPTVPGGDAFTPGHDAYFGDPVVVVDQSARQFAGQPGQAAGEFYYSSIYKLPDGTFSLAVNRGHFQTAPPQTPESVSNTRCLNDPTQQGVPDTSNLPSERIVWERPSIAVPVTDPGALLDKEWLYLSPVTGELYLTYTRFGSDGSTPLELVRSKNGGRTWEGPFVIVPNLNDTFNQATQAMMTSTGRLVVTYIARTFAAGGSGPESDDRIEAVYSDDDGTTFTPNPVVVQHVNPQGEPPGYNRNRRSILNGPYIAPQTDGTNVYITYFNGKTPLQQGGGIFTGPLGKMADIMLGASHDNGTTWTTTKVNDDAGNTSHVFPSVQVNKQSFVYVGWLDRRVDPNNNELTDAWAAVSKDGGASFSPSREQSDVSTSWRARADARPNFGDYTSSDLLNGNQFLMIWADARFPPGTFTPPTCTPAPPCAPRPNTTPDTIFTIANGLGS